MQLPAIKPTNSTQYREALIRLEDAMRQQPECKKGGDDNVTHHFAPGVYVRELFIPAGQLLTGCIHKTDHVSIMLSGRMLVSDGHGGHKEITGPMTEVAKAGIKRVGFSIEDTTWVTVHPTEETDLAIITDALIAKDFSEVQHLLDQQDYETFVEQYQITDEDINGLALLPHYPVESEKAILAPSTRHGTGVFATGVIHAGEVIAPTMIGDKETQFGRHANHSCYPNAVVCTSSDGSDLVALRQIDSEEITVDYRQVIERLRV